MDSLHSTSQTQNNIDLLPSSCITLEEHATFRAVGDESPFYTEIWKTFPDQRRALLDHDTERLADMDAGHVSIQVLSQLPGTGMTNPSGCRAANDELAAVIKAHPTRFAGWAVLAMVDPNGAAQELERAVKELGLVGAMIDDHLPDMTHYDDKRFWPVFAAAERLDVPIYLHPAPASDSVMIARFNGADGGYSTALAQGLSTGAWGWHEYLGLHVVKLFAAGLFQQFPRLKIVIGHMGEMIPMMIDRIERLKFFKRGGLGSFRAVWERNVWVTTSGIFSVRTLEMLLKVTPVERVLCSVDTPFESNVTGWAFIEELARSGLLSKDEMDQFVQGNARKLLKI
jgi:predicted TIM-barrel fold metal-dependent hydrolase